MRSSDKNRVVAEIAWRVYQARPESERISLGSSRYDLERVERDFELLGVREFSAKYETFIHKEK